MASRAVDPPNFEANQLSVLGVSSRSLELRFGGAMSFELVSSVPRFLEAGDFLPSSSLEEASSELRRPLAASLSFLLLLTLSFVGVLGDFDEPPRLSSGSLEDALDSSFFLGGGAFGSGSRDSVEDELSDTLLPSFMSLSFWAAILLFRLSQAALASPVDFPYHSQLTL